MGAMGGLRFVLQKAYRVAFSGAQVSHNRPFWNKRITVYGLPLRTGDHRTRRSDRTWPALGGILRERHVDVKSRETLFEDALRWTLVTQSDGKLPFRIPYPSTAYYRIVQRPFVQGNNRQRDFVPTKAVVYAYHDLGIQSTSMGARTTLLDL